MHILSLSPRPIGLEILGVEPNDLFYQILQKILMVGSNLRTTN